MVVWLLKGGERERERAVAILAQAILAQAIWLKSGSSPWLKGQEAQTGCLDTLYGTGATRLRLTGSYPIPRASLPLLVIEVEEEAALCVL